MYSIKPPPMPTETVMSMIQIIQEVQNGTAIREMAAVNLLQFDPNNKNVYKFAKVTAQLIKELPRLSIAEDSNEMELCSRFVDPFLSELFDDPDQHVFLRWINETTLEAKNEQSLLSWRPDLCITRLQGAKWSSSLGFGEAKPACQESNLNLICRDLLRVAMFCKDALDSQKVVGVLGLQIVGRSITFYVLTLPLKRFIYYVRNYKNTNTRFFMRDHSNILILLTVTFYTTSLF